MKILSVNNTSPNFNGKIITKGAWTYFLKNELEKNPEIAQLASGKKDIIADFSHKKAQDPFHYKGEDVYKLKLTAVPPKMGILDKIKYYLHMMPTVNVTQDYHREYSLDFLIRQRVKAEKFAKELGLTDVLQSFKK